MHINPYLIFNGRCDEALDFYGAKVGAKIEQLMRFKDNPDNPPPDKVPPGSADKVMHAAMKIGDSDIFLADGWEYGGQPKFDGFALTISVPDAAEADRVFNALLDGGKVTMPIGKTFFSSRFGMLQDKFGVGWMVIAPATA